MSTPVVVCPHPPLLLRELGGLADPVADLRASCRAAVGELVAGDARRGGGGRARGDRPVVGRRAVP